MQQNLCRIKNLFMVYELLFSSTNLTIITGMPAMMIFYFLDNNHNMHITE